MQNAIIPKTIPSLNHLIAVNLRKAPQLLIPCPSWLNPSADPSASSVKPLRFAPMNAHPAALTARTDRRSPAAIVILSWAITATARMIQEFSALSLGV
jgi:hypothetical protein